VSTEAREHPKYYNNHPKGIECWDVVEDFPFNLANAIKYIWRAGLKPGAGYKDDLEKAIHYLQRQLNRSALYEPPTQPDTSIHPEVTS
jgi:hypothetical protein